MAVLIEVGIENPRVCDATFESTFPRGVNAGRSCKPTGMASEPGRFVPKDAERSEIVAFVDTQHDF